MILQNFAKSLIWIDKLLLSGSDGIRSVFISYEQLPETNSQPKSSVKYKKLPVLKKYREFTVFIFHYSVCFSHWLFFQINFRPSEVSADSIWERVFTGRYLPLTMINFWFFSYAKIRYILQSRRNLWNDWICSARMIWKNFTAGRRFCIGRLLFSDFQRHYINILSRLYIVWFDCTIQFLDGCLLCRWRW